MFKHDPWKVYFASMEQPRWTFYKNDNKTLWLSSLFNEGYIWSILMALDIKLQLKNLKNHKTTDKVLL